MFLDPKGIDFGLKWSTTPFEGVAPYLSLAKEDKKRALAGSDMDIYVLDSGHRKSMNVIRRAQKASKGTSGLLLFDGYLKQAEDYLK